MKKIFNTVFLGLLIGGFVFADVPAGVSVALGGATPDIDLTSEPTAVNMFPDSFKAGSVANDPRIIIKRIINVVMGFLGMLAILLILFAGFKWMTAAGNKENAEAAAKMLRDGVIGLIIIFSAWTIAWFVVNTLKINIKT